MNTLNIRKPAARHYCSQGITLIELMIVLLIIVLAFGITGILVRRGSGNLELKTTSKHMTTTLRFARNRAITEKKVYVFIVPVDKKTYGLYTDLPQNEDLDEASPVVSHPIPEKITVTFQDQKGPGIIEFYPRGTSSGGTIEITNQKGSRYSIHVNRITGNVELEDDEIS